jgi:hypothetical protein
MCFFASASIDGPTLNGLVILVEAFTMLFYHLFLILFVQREANCKHDNTDNNQNATKVCQELTNWASATGVHNLLGFEGSLLLWPLFLTSISGGHWPVACSCGYELVTKKKLWMHFSNYFPYHPFRHTYMPSRVIHLPWSASVSTLLSLYRHSDEFFVGPYLTKSKINFRMVLQPSNRYLHTFIVH